MLDANGRHTLKIIGKTSAEQGILLAAQMPAAIAQLETAIEQEQAELKHAMKGVDVESLKIEDAPSLRHRSMPFVKLLRQCVQVGSAVVWGF
jgi:hypothetical protein